MVQMERLGPHSGSEDLGFKSHQVMSHAGFYSLGRSYPELGVLWSKWKGWDHTAGSEDLGFQIPSSNESCGILQPWPAPAQS